MFFNPISLQLQQHPWNWACENPSIEILFLNNLHEIYTYLAFGSQIWWPHFLQRFPSKEMHILDEKTEAPDHVLVNPVIGMAHKSKPSCILLHKFNKKIWNLISSWQTLPVFYQLWERKNPPQQGEPSDNPKT